MTNHSQNMDVEIKNISAEEDSYDDHLKLLQEMGFNQMDVDDVLDRLEAIMTIEQNTDMVQEYLNMVDNPDQDERNIIWRYVRQFANPFRLKFRNLNLGRYHEGGEEVDHYGVFFDNDGIIYHHLPDGIHNGEHEYNKEIASYDWQTVTDKPYYTLITHNEIEEFNKKWNKKDGVDNAEYAIILSRWLMINI